MAALAHVMPRTTAAMPRYGGCTTAFMYLSMAEEPSILNPDWAIALARHCNATTLAESIFAGCSFSYQWEIHDRGTACGREVAIRMR